MKLRQGRTLSISVILLLSTLTLHVSFDWKSAPVVPLHAVLYMPVVRVSGLPRFVVRAAEMRCRVGLSSKKGSQFYYAIGLWPSLKREAHYNKNFFKSQINIIYILPQEWIIYFVLFLLILFKFCLRLKR